MVGCAGFEEENVSHSNVGMLFDPYIPTFTQSAVAPQT